jgi:hypothetical protein
MYVHVYIYIYIYIYILQDFHFIGYHAYETNIFDGFEFLLAMCNMWAVQTGTWTFPWDIPNLFAGPKVKPSKEQGKLCFTSSTLKIKTKLCFSWSYFQDRLSLASLRYRLSRLRLSFASLVHIFKTGTELFFSSLSTLKFEAKLCFSCSSTLKTEAAFSFYLTI